MPADGSKGTAALPLGAWSPDRTVLAEAPRALYGDVSDLSADVRFQVHVARLISAREQRPDTERSGAAAFLLVTPQQHKAWAQRLTFDRNLHTGRVQLAGRIHFVTDLAGSSAYEDYAGSDTGLFDRLAALQCDRLPALIYLPDRHESSLTFYPQGTHDDRGLVPLKLNHGPVTEAEILAAIDGVYRTELCTPDNSGPIKLWHDPLKGRPIEEAERTVQQFVRSGLAARFNWCTIYSEQAGKVGRTDLEIVDDRTGPLGQVTHHALLELKVLRTFSQSGTRYPPASAGEAVTKGVQQAHEYGGVKNSLLRMLCCFDMRMQDAGDAATFASIKSSADALCVRLVRWYLYRSADDYRRARTGAQLAALGPTAAPAG
jgi:hypothetical protein